MEINILINILLFTLIGWFFYKRVASVKGLENLSEKQLNDKLKNTNSLLIDVRETHEFTNGHIPMAINIPLSKFNQSIAEIPKDKELILYCQSGMRSKQAARILRKKNDTKTSHLTGGIGSWSGSKIKGKV